MSGGDEHNLADLPARCVRAHRRADRAAQVQRSAHEARRLAEEDLTATARLPASGPLAARVAPFRLRFAATQERMPGSQAAAFQKANVIQQTAPALAPNAPWVVLKFGGTSVSTRPRWENIRRIAAAHRARGRRVLIVVSALSGITDQLKAIAESRADARALRARARRDRRAARGDAARARSGVARRARSSGSPISIGSSPIRAAHRGDVAWQAEVFALGELMSSHARRCIPVRHRRGQLADALARRARAPARRGVAEPERVGPLSSASVAAAPDAAFARALAERGDVFVTQGFIARNADGETVVLGRGGSDTSAGYFGALLKAELVEIWTDVPGMFSANPRQVPEARLLARLDYEEAQEIATTGAKVLHPRALSPLRARRRAARDQGHEPPASRRHRDPRRRGRCRAVRQGDQLAQGRHAGLDGNGRHVAAGRLPRRRVRRVQAPRAVDRPGRLGRNERHRVARSDREPGQLRRAVGARGRSCESVPRQGHRAVRGDHAGRARHALAAASAVRGAGRVRRARRAPDLPVVEQSQSHVRDRRGARRRVDSAAACAADPRRCAARARTARCSARAGARSRRSRGAEARCLVAARARASCSRSRTSGTPRYVVLDLRDGARAGARAARARRRRSLAITR